MVFLSRGRSHCVDSKLFTAVFLVRFIAPTSRLHAVKAALSSSSQALIAFSKASPWSQHYEHPCSLCHPPEQDYSLATTRTGARPGTDVLSSIKLHASSRGPHVGCRPHDTARTKAQRPSATRHAVLAVRLHPRCGDSPGGSLEVHNGRCVVGAIERSFIQRS